MPPGGDAGPDAGARSVIVSASPFWFDMADILSN
jgi:hypothetical protein